MTADPASGMSPVLVGVDGSDSALEAVRWAERAMPQLMVLG